MKFCGACIITDNVSRLSYFYSKVFKSLPEGNENHAAFNDMNLAIWNPGNTETSEIKNMSLMYFVDDAMNEYERLSTIDGIEMVSKPEKQPWGVIAFVFKDPDGNEINFIQQEKAIQSKNRVENKEFWQATDQLVAESEMVIDRPKGSRHPRYPDIVYQVDYGYLKGTTSMDGGGIDVWKGTRENPAVDAVMCIVDLVKRDSEIKLLFGCTEEEKSIVYRFHNGSEYMKGILIERKDLI